ncbi:protein of unknown function (plasmid) [Caballeronia sp. S22]
MCLEFFGQEYFQETCVSIAIGKGSDMIGPVSLKTGLLGRATVQYMSRTAVLSRDCPLGD